MAYDIIIQEMIALGVKKLQLLKEVWDLTEKLAQHCVEDQLIELQRLLDERQKHIDIINMLDKNFEEKSKAIKEKFNIEFLDQINLNLYPKARELKKVREDINNYLKRIRSLDDENRKVMEELFQATKMELRKIRQGKTANRLYQYEFSGSGGTFFDTKK